MAAETELESLVIRLLGDQSDYQKMINDAVSTTQQAASSMGSATKEVAKVQTAATTQTAEAAKAGATAQKEMSQAVGETAPQAEKAAASLKGLALAAAGAVAAYAGFAALKGFLGDFQEAEAISLKLNAVLEANGREVESLRADYEGFAAEIQKTTVVGDDTALSFLHMAETFELTGDAAKSAVKNAIALAGAVDGTAASAGNYIRFAAAMEKGDIELAMSMGRMIPQLRGVTDQTEFAAKAQKLMAAGMKTVEAEAASSAGKMKQLGEEWGNFKETLGSFVADAVTPVVAALKGLATWLNELPGWVKGAVVVVMGLSVAVVALTTAFAVVKMALAAVAAPFAALTAAIGLSTGAMAAWAGGLALAGVAVYKLTQFVYNLHPEVQKLNQSLKEGAELSDKLQGIQQGKRSKVLEEVQKKEGTREEKQAFAEEAIKRAQKELIGYKAHVESAKRQVEELNTNWNRLTGNKILELHQKELEEFRKKAADAQKHVQDLQNELNKLKLNKKVLTDIKEFEKSLRDANETFGMTDTEKKVHEFRKLGAEDKDVKGILEEADINKQLEAEKAVTDLEDALRLQAQTFGMTAEQAEIYKLKLKGISDERLLNIKNQQDFIKAQQKEARAFDDLKQFMAEGKRIMEEFATPQEKFTKRMEELSKFLNEGAIDQDTFTRAVKDAEDQLKKATGQAAELKKELGAIQGAASGSAEALERLNAFQDRIRLPQIKGADMPGQMMGQQPMQPVNQPRPVEQNPPGAENQREQNGFLRDIRDTLWRIEKKGGLDIKFGLG